MTFFHVGLLPWQADFLCCTDRVAGVVGGLGSGKTTIVAHWFVDRFMAYPAGNHVVVGKDLPQLKNGTLISLREAIKERGIEYTYNSSTGEIYIEENGARIMAKGARNYEGFRSLEADTIWADELADWGPSGEKAFTQYIAPRLRVSPAGKKYLPENGGDLRERLRFSSNPPLSTNHWLYRMCVTDNYCRVWNVSVRDNFTMGDRLQPYIESVQRGLSPNLWPILVDGQWGNATVGSVYRTFKRARHCAIPPPPLKPLEYDPTKPILWTLDFNVNLMCSVIAQLHPQRRIVEEYASHNPLNFALPPELQGFAGYRPAKQAVEVQGYAPFLIYFLKELRLKNAGVPDVADAFVQIYRQQNWKQQVILYGDASGGGKSQHLSSRASARSAWALIAERLRKERIPFSFRLQSANPSVMDRVNAVNSQLGTLGDETGLLVDEQEAPWLCVDFETVDWEKGGTNEIDKKTDPDLTHLSDAAGYLVWMERMLFHGKPVNFAKNPMEL